MIYREGKKGKPDFWGCSNFPTCRHMEKMELRTQIKGQVKKGIILTIGGLIFIAFSIFYVQKVFEKMGKSFQENAKNIQEKAQADMAKAKREAEKKQAKLEAKKQATEEQARQLELTRFKEEIAQHQAEDNKKAEFESQYKPRAECNDPDLEWSKTVQCKNEKITAREEFYRTH